MKHLKPIIKWTGGKRKEIKIIADYFPDFVRNNEPYTYVEPFVGGGAVYWQLNNIGGKNIINDYDRELINFYRLYAENNKELQDKINRLAEIKDLNELKKIFYHYRNMDRNGMIDTLSPVDLAVRFYVMLSLAFCGMRRFNLKGQCSNSFSYQDSILPLVYTLDHTNLLQSSTITQGDFELIIKANDNPKTFIFVDPPYLREINHYSPHTSFLENEHKRLAKCLRSLKHASFMMVINTSDFILELYDQLIKKEYDYKYSVGNKSTPIKHLIISNY